MLHAQSGRNRGTKTQTEKSTDKTDITAPEPGVNESRINPDGETVEGDVIRFDTSLVTVPVSVLDRSGRYVPVLKRENFRILENGVEQKIAYFATTDSPFTVILLIDTSGSTHFRLDEIQDAAINFVSKLKSNDSVMVMAFDDRIDVLSKPTTIREERPAGPGPSSPASRRRSSVAATGHSPSTGSMATLTPSCERPSIRAAL